MMEHPAAMDRQPTPRRLPIAPFLTVLARRRRLVIGLTLGAAIVAAAFSRMAPITYESSLSILPPEQSSPFGLSAGGLASSLANLQLGFGKTNASALYADMLLSRSVRRYVIDKLGLIDIYGLARMTDTLKAVTYALGQLEADIDVATFRNGMIVVNARAHTGFFPGPAAKDAARRRSAQIADAMAEGLEAVNREKNTNQARRARLYLEEQLALNDAALDKASRDLAEFQRAHMAISLDDQMRVGIETAGTLEGEMLAREVALGVALQTMSAGNPEVRRLQGELGSLRNRLVQLQRGMSGPGKSGTPDSLVLGLEQLPELGRLYAFKLREVKIQEKLYELLTEQLYQARIKETETLPVIQVLDEARVPIYKKSPIVRKTAVIAGLLGLILAVLIAHGLEWWQGYAWREEDGRVIRDLLRR
jgi:tyrosine-protein kinase Etk/Wzc